MLQWITDHAGLLIWIIAFFLVIRIGKWWLGTPVCPQCGNSSSFTPFDSTVIGHRGSYEGVRHRVMCKNCGAFCEQVCLLGQKKGSWVAVSNRDYQEETTII